MRYEELLPIATAATANTSGQWTAADRRANQISDAQLRTQRELLNFAVTGRRYADPELTKLKVSNSQLSDALKEVTSDPPLLRSGPLTLYPLSPRPLIWFRFTPAYLIRYV